MKTGPEMEDKMERTIRLLSIEQASQALGISPAEAWRHVMEGNLNAVRINDLCMISEMQLMFFKQQHPSLLAAV